MVVSIIQNYSYSNSSHYCIIKFINFVQIYYIININDVSSFMVFNEFICVYINVLLI